MMSLNRRVVGAAAFFVVFAGFVTTEAQAPLPAYANFEESQTNPIRLSPDGMRLFAVNTANASLSVFDVTVPATPKLVVEIPVGLGPVSVNPRTNDEVWVVNQISNSISVVSVPKGIVVHTIDLPAEPMDVVFAGINQAYVSVSRSNQIAVIDTPSFKQTAMIPVFGGNPRALDVSPDGSTVYAAFALSGNATTIIPSGLAPAPCGTAGAPQCIPPMNPALPPPPQVPLIVAATDPAWTSYITFKMPDNDVVAIKTGASPSIARYYSGVGTINLGLAVNPVTGDLFVANTDALNLTFFEPNLCGHWVNNRLTRIQVSSGQVTPFDLNPNATYGCAPNPADLSTALAQPTAVVFDPRGSFMYVAAFGTDRVAKVDTNGNVMSFVEVSLAGGSGSKADPANKRGPRGLALNAGARTLYCLNRIANTISIINTDANVVSSEVATGTDPTPATVKAGRGFLYDAKLSGTGNGSCASCHIDGDMDHLAWNLGDPTGSMASTVQDGVTILFHPMKGPMVTQTLRGLLNLSPYHWRGDRADFSAFNPAFASLMGGSQLSSADMATFTTFANSILYLPNPNQKLDRTLPTSLAGGNPVNGEIAFLTVAETREGDGPAVTCQSCHTSDPGPGSNRIIRTNTVQPMKTPQLRNEYQKQLYTLDSPQSIDGFGIHNAGDTTSLLAFFEDPAFVGYTATQAADIAAYEMCFDTGTAPAVGQTRTLASNNVAETQGFWATLESQAKLGNIGLIANGTIQSQVRKLWYQPSNNTYVSDTLAVYTHAQLETFIERGDFLSIMGVYPGTSANH